MVQNLCIHFSAPLPIPASTDLSAQTFHPFPPPSVLADASVSNKLRGLGFGYRAAYIQRTAAMLIEEHETDDGVYEFLLSLRSKSTTEARNELLKLMGVGRKVADCILLMSLDKVSSAKENHIQLFDTSYRRK